MRTARDRHGVKWWFFPLAVVAGLAAILFVFFFHHVPQRRDYFIKRNLRMLDEASKQIIDAVGNLHEALTNAAMESYQKAPKGGPKLRESFEGHIALISPKPSILQPLALIETNSSADKAVGKAALKEQAEVHLVREVDHGRLDIVCDDLRSDPEKGDKNLMFEVGVDLAELLTPILNHYEFDDVLLVDTNADVMFQLSASGLRITNLLLNSELRITRFPKSEKKAASENPHPADTAGDDPFGGASGLRDINLAESQYKLFEQPIWFSLSGDEKSRDEMRWFLCGLVRSKAFYHKTVEISAPSLFILLGGAAFVLLSWPFFSIKFAAFGEPIHRVHAWGAAACGGLACVVLVFLLADCFWHLQIEQEFDRALPVLSSNLVRNFTSELKLCALEFTNLNQRLLNDGDLKNHVRKPAEWAGWLKNHEEDKRRILRDGTVAETDPYPFFDLVTWATTNGEQIFKWTSLSEVTPRVSLKHRRFFGEVLNNTAWPVYLNASNVFPVSSFYIEPVYSKTRNRNVAVLAVPFHDLPSHRWPSDPEMLRTNRPAMVYMEYRPISLFRPILPLGYGFCIVDADGQVLFHSQEGRNLRENLFKEISQKARSQAAVRARTVDAFDQLYWSDECHMRFEPMAGFPWTVVTFRQKSQFQTVRYQIAEGAALLFAAYLLFCMTVFLLWLLIRGVYRIFFKPRSGDQFHFAWIWPARQRSLRYLVIFLLNVTLCSVSFWFILFGSPEKGFILAAVCWLPGALLLYRVGDKIIRLVRTVSGVLLDRWSALQILEAGLLRIRTKWQELGDFLRLGLTKFAPMDGAVPARSLYMLCLASLFWAGAALPALGCFQYAFWKEHELFVKGNQIKIVLDREARDRRLRKAWHEYGIPEAFLSNRMDSELDSYASAFLNTRITAITTNDFLIGEKKDRLFSLYQTIRPIHEIGDREAFGLLAAQAADGSWSTKQGTSTLSLTHLQERGTSQGVAWNVSSEAPAAKLIHKPNLGSTSFFSFIFLLFASAILFLVQFIARHLLLLDAPRGPSSARESRLLLLAPSSEQFSRDKSQGFAEIESANVKVIDLALCQSDTPLKPGCWQEWTSDCVLVLQNLDFAIHKKLVELRNSLVPLLQQEPALVIVGVASNGLGALQAAASNAGDPWGDWIKSFKHLPMSQPSRRSRRINLCAELRQTVMDALERAFSLSIKQCATRERIILWQVAKTGLVDGSRPELRSLLAAGLIRLDPKLRVQNEVFRRFLLSRSEQLEKEQSKLDPQITALSWQSIRMVLGLSVTALAIFLFFTQQELWSRTITLVTAFGGVFGHLQQLFQAFRGSPGSKLPSVGEGS